MRSTILLANNNVKISRFR